MLPVKYALYFKSSSAEAFPLGTSFGVLKLNPQEVVLEAKVKLESIVLEYKLKAHKDKTPAGSISTKEVEKDLKEKYGILIDKRKFVDKYPMNAFGYTNLKIELYKGVIGTIRVHISEE